MEGLGRPAILLVQNRFYLRFWSTQYSPPLERPVRMSFGEREDLPGMKLAAFFFNINQGYYILINTE